MVLLSVSSRLMMNATSSRFLFDKNISLIRIVVKNGINLILRLRYHLINKMLYDYLYVNLYIMRGKLRW